QSTKRPVPAAEAEIRVHNWLIKNAKNPADVTIRKVVQETGVSQGGVQQTPAWQAFQAKRKEQGSTSPRTVPWSVVILPSAQDDTEDDPSAIAEQSEDEAIWHKLLQGAESSDKRHLLIDMPDNKRRELIEAYRQQLRDDADDRHECSRR